jgi:DNA-binding response OmpR family regulator
MAVTGKSALRVALENPPDAIILDVDLPDTDGYTLMPGHAAHQHASHRSHRDVDGAFGQTQRDRGSSGRRRRLLTKPIDTERLQARLENALSRNIRELDANPLTHLPGNTSILQEMERRLRKQEPFAVIYSDLNNFKAFNDRYGFLRGDQAIKLAAQCIVFSVEGRAAQSVVMTGNWFIGHVGGDDFVVILPAEKAEDVSREIIKRFDAAVPDLYDPEDARGDVSRENAAGRTGPISVRWDCPGDCFQWGPPVHSSRRNQFHGQRAEKLRQVVWQKRFRDGSARPSHSHERDGGRIRRFPFPEKRMFPRGKKIEDVLPPDIFSELGSLRKVRRLGKGVRYGRKKNSVIDDDVQLCQLTSDILEEHGFQTMVANNTDQGFKKLYEDTPDLILLDVWLPSIGGLEFCRQIRQDPRGRHVPVLMLTVQDKESDKVMGLEMGADDYMTKPFSQRELLARIKALLRRFDRAQPEIRLFPPATSRWIWTNTRSG